MKVTFRAYEHRDREGVVELFRRQGHNTYLPIKFDPQEPEKGGDVAVSVALVGEDEEGQIVRAMIARVEMEVYWVTDEQGVSQVKQLLRMSRIAEKMAMFLGARLARAGFPVPIDVRARVSKHLPRMIEFMKRRLGFVVDRDDFVGLTRRIGS